MFGISLFAGSKNEIAERVVLIATNLQRSRLYSPAVHSWQAWLWWRLLCCCCCWCWWSWWEWFVPMAVTSFLLWRLLLLLLHGANRRFINMTSQTIYHCICCPHCMNTQLEIYMPLILEGRRTFKVLHIWQLLLNPLSRNKYLVYWNNDLNWLREKRRPTGSGPRYTTRKQCIRTELTAALR